MIIPDHVRIDGLGLDIMSFASSVAKTSTQAATAVDWSKVITQASDSINKAIETAGSAQTTLIKAKIPAFLPAPVYQYAQPAYQQQTMAPLFGNMDTTTVILVAGGALVLLSLAFIVMRK